MKRYWPTGAPWGTLPRRQGRETRLGPLNLPLIRKNFSSGKSHRGLVGIGEEGLWKARQVLERSGGQSEPTHFLPQFYPLFKRIVWAGEEKRSNRQQDLKLKPAASELS